MVNDNRPDLAKLVAMMMKDKSAVDRETKKLLVKELRAMAEFEGVYSEFKNISTPIMSEIWFAAADYLAREK